MSTEGDQMDVENDGRGRFGVNKLRVTSKTYHLCHSCLHCRMQWQTEQVGQTISGSRESRNWAYLPRG